MSAQVNSKFTRHWVSESLTSFWIIWFLDLDVNLVWLTEVLMPVLEGLTLSMLATEKFIKYYSDCAYQNLKEIALFFSLDVLFLGGLLGTQAIP